jgi:hypothetical protein
MLQGKNLYKGESSEKEFIRKNIQNSLHETLSLVTPLLLRGCLREMTVHHIPLDVSNGTISFPFCLHLQLLKEKRVSWNHMW